MTNEPLQYTYPVDKISIKDLAIRISTAKEVAEWLGAEVESVVSVGPGEDWLLLSIHIYKSKFAKSLWEESSINQTNEQSFNNG